MKAVAAEKDAERALDKSAEALALTKNMLAQSKPATDEYAVMIDARDPLDVGEAAASVENTGYVDSWKTPG